VRHRHPRAIALALAPALLIAACSRGEDEADRPAAVVEEPSATATASPSPTPSPSATPPARPDFDALSVRLEPVLPNGALDQPTDTASLPDGSGLLVTERVGRVRLLRDGQVAPQPLLDLSDDTGRRGEQGMFSLAVHPAGDRVYVSYTDKGGDSVLAEYPLDGASLDETGRREVLRVDQPYANHNGGQVTFGPDELLWWSLGDGGGSGDPQRNGQDVGTLLGSVLRIDPQPSGDRAYTVPADNPFTGREGARPEIWAYGLRNPWRFSFDPATDEMWIGDVGQAAVEEIDRLRVPGDAGANLGWPLMEGDRPFRGGQPPADHLGPVHVYPHDERCSVTGGKVYRGEAVPALRGAYLFADLCDRRVRALDAADPSRVRDLGLQVEGSLISFALDERGEILVLSQDGGIWRIVGA
jgi:glucose/arabinose dehydrogenase